jgi:ABC-type lipoprotein release transport system permease subunit
LGYLVARGSEDAIERSLIEGPAIAAARKLLPPDKVAEELVHMGPALAGDRSAPLTWRGIDQAVPALRQQIQVAAGAWPDGADEALVGHRAARELGLSLGDRVQLLEHEFTVVGRLDPGAGFAGSEIWVPLETLQRVTGRDHSSLLVVRDAASAVSMLALTRQDLGLVEVAEVDYLARVASGLAPLRTVAWIVSGLLVLAAATGALVAAVARADARRQVLATARAIGVGPWRLAAWLLGEVAVAALLGGLLTYLALSLLDGTVLRLGTVAPVLSVDIAVFAAAALAIFVAALLTLAPILVRTLITPLPRQLREV